MSWLDDLLEASLGGVPFLAAEITRQLGRRTSTIEFPGRDLPASQDHGRSARRWSVTAVVVGDDYNAQRQRLVEVIEKAGPYSFVDPWWGEFEVVLAEGSPVEVRESAAEGGIARITFSLVEAGADLDFIVIPSDAAALPDAGAAAYAAAAEDFADTVGDLEGDAYDAAVAAVGDVLNEVAAINNKINGALGAADAVTGLIEDARDEIGDLLDDPLVMAGRLAALWDLLGDALAGADHAALRRDTAAGLALELVSRVDGQDYRGELAWDGEPLDETADEPRRALTLLARRQGLIALGSAFGGIAVASASMAAAVVDVVGGTLQAAAAEDGTADEVFEALSDLRIAVDAAMADLRARLPTAIVVIPPIDTPALMIAWLTVGDPTRDLEIVDRNRIVDPNRARAGEPVEVLPDA